MDDCPLGPGVDGGGWRETPGSGGGDGGEGDSILGRETPGSGGADGGEGRSILGRETPGSGGADGGEGRSILGRETPGSGGADGGEGRSNLGRETPGSGGADGGEGRSILGRETPGSGGGDGGEWEGDRCGEFCNRIRFFSRNLAALSCWRRLLDHGLRPVSDMDLWGSSTRKEKKLTSITPSRTKNDTCDRAHVSDEHAH